MVVSLNQGLAVVHSPEPLFDPQSPDSAIMHYEPKALGSHRRSVTPFQPEQPDAWRAQYYRSPVTAFKVRTLAQDSIWN